MSQQPVPDGSVLDRIADVLRDVFDDDDIRVQTTTTAADVDGWDSVTNVEVMVALERAFGVRFKTAELAGFENLGDLARTVQDRMC